MSSIKTPLVTTLIVGILGFGLFMEARQIEQGVRHEYHGRRAGSKQAMAALAEKLGPTGSLIVWLTATGLSGTWLVVALKTRKKSSE